MSGQQAGDVLYSSGAKLPSYIGSKWTTAIWDLTKQEGTDLFCRQQRLTLHSNMILHSKISFQTGTASFVVVNREEFAITTWDRTLKCVHDGSLPSLIHRHFQPVTLPANRKIFRGAGHAVRERDESPRSTSILLPGAMKGRERPRESRVSPARPRPCPPRSLPPPSAHPSPPLKAGCGAAEGYKRPLGREGRERRVAGAAVSCGAGQSAAPWLSPCGATTRRMVRGSAGQRGPGWLCGGQGSGSAVPLQTGRPGWNGGGPLGGSQPGWRCWWPSLAFPPGPEHWHQNYPMAKGDKQSPIEINSKDVRHDTSLSPWHASYDPGAAKTILNNGRTCRVVFDDTFDRSGQLLFCLWGVIRNEGLQSAWNQSIPQQLAHTNEEFV